MFANWQSAVTLLLIAWAIGYVAWRGWRIFVRKQAAGCGTCAKCPVDGKEPTPLIQIESLASAPGDRRQRTS